MIAYGLGILHLIKNLKTDFPGITQPWYADAAGSLGVFARIKAYFHSLEQHGPGRGYYIEPSKSVLSVHPKNIKARKLFGLRHRFKVCMGTRYLGRYIRDKESNHEWSKERTETWKRNICTISKTAGKYPQ